jgi:hypothetical protein
MAKDVDWIKKRVTEAQKRNESVTEAVSDRIEKLLSGDLSERLLSPARLATMAKALIEDMFPAPSVTETKQ